MRRTFEHFHLSLKPNYPLFEPHFVQRDEWLRQIFAESFHFVHYGKTFTWVPVSTREVIVGKIMRQNLEEKFLPPEQRGKEVKEREWYGAIVVIDPTKHVDGQKAAVERRRQVGKANAVLASLLIEASKRVHAVYTIEAERVWDVGHFNNWASAHGFRVKKIRFDFVVPNMWDTTGELEEELRAIGSTTKAQKVRVEFGGQGIVETNNVIIEQAVEYSARGSGRVVARSEDDDVFDSEGSPTVVSLEEVPDVSDIDEGELGTWSDRILGREKGPV